VIVRPVDVLPERGTLGLVDSIVLRGGGCALNTASALAKLGLRAGVVGKVGADAFGDFIVRTLAERGVDAAGVIRDAAAATSASVALVESAGERTFLHATGANATLTTAEVREEPFRGRALHIAGALVLDELDGDPTASLLSEARRRGIVTSIDTVFDARGYWDRLLPALPFCDLVTPGLHEARAITDEEEPPAAARRLRELGARVAAVTCGADGCYVAGDSFEGHVAGFQLESVDGTGAGDAFAAGFLCGLLAARPLEECALLANAAGGFATRAIGAFEGVGDLDETEGLAGLA
jgi:sugar/nucleoside kinase (ribokinase family)